MTKQTAIAVALVLVTTLFPGVPQPTSAASAQEEELLKAAFVYNFAKYTSWPGEPSDAFSLCLTGTDKIFDALQRLHGQSIKGRDVTIREVALGEPAVGCNILVIGCSEEERVGSVIASMSTPHLLTVGDLPGFAENGGVIGLVKEGKKIRFAVNLEAARQAGLKISSRLLNLAKIVGEDGAK